MAETYGQAIRRFRDKKGLTQQQLADLVHIGRETLSRAEQGGNVGVLTLYEIADVLDVEISDFFGGSSASDEQPPASWWSRLKTEQRARVERYARRLLGERVPPKET